MAKQRAGRRGAARFPIEPEATAQPDLFSFRIGKRQFAVLAFEERQVAAAPAVALTDAESAVASLALEGLSNAEIAARRRAAVRTVCNQLASVYRKLGVRSRVELAVHARFFARRPAR